MKFNENWLQRSMQVARHIPGGVTVLDLGAGDLTLGRLLLPGCAYAPVDKEQWLGQGYQADFNDDAVLPLPFYSVGVVAGVLEHLNDPLRFLSDWSCFAGKWLITCHDKNSCFVSICETMHDAGFRCVAEHDITRGNYGETLFIFEKEKK